MSTEDRPQERVARIVQTTRIVVLALSVGVLTFAAVVLMQVRPDLQAPLGILTILAVAVALADIGMSVVLPRVIAANQCRQIAAGTWQPPPRSAVAPPADNDSSKLAAVYQTKTIVGAALLEGAAFFALIAHRRRRAAMDRSPPPLAGGAAAIIALKPADKLSG